MAIQVSPPVKLGSKEGNCFVLLENTDIRNSRSSLLPYAVDSRMHCKKIAYFRTFPSDTTNQAFCETGQVKAVHHMKGCHRTLIAQ
jgi:hypothetical protein